MCDFETGGPMNEPYLRTFQFLSHSENPHALPVLIAGLGAIAPEIRVAASEAIILRRQTNAHLELIRRIDLHSPGMIDLLRRNLSPLAYALRQSILQGDETLRSNALSIASAAESYLHLSTIIQYFERPNIPDRPQVVELIRHLADSFYNFLNLDHHTPQSVRDPINIRDQLLDNLEQAIPAANPDDLPVLLETLMILAPLDHRSIKNLLRPAPDPIRAAGEKIMMESTHPAVMSKIIDLMAYDSAPLKAVQIIRRRTDPEFVSHLIRLIPARLTQNWFNNFKRIDSLNWLENAEEVCEQIPPALHLRLVHLISETNVSDFERHRVLTWVMKNGAPEARSAATRILSEVDNSLVQDLVMNGIESREEEVQAWATTQLRVCKIPQTFEMLIERLDSPLSQVRDAARAELGDFNLQKFLSVFDESDPEVCVRAGRLMQKIDHDFIDQLRREVEHPIRTKRLRAIRASGAMQLQTPVVDSLLKQLDDEEPSVRRAAVDALKYILKPEVVSALSHTAQQDKNARVREDAVRACQQMKLYMSQSMSQPTSKPVAPAPPPPASHL